MDLPTKKESLLLFKKYKVPKHLMQHCLSVNKFALKLIENIDCNKDLVDRATLLHDIFKMATIKSLQPTKEYNITYSGEEITMWKKLREAYPGMHENEIFHQIYKKTYPELARCILNSSNPRRKRYTIEEKIVHYADWRILKEKEVLLEERLNYLQKKYPHPNWPNYIHKIKKIEKDILRRIKK